ncbi:MAG TPA: hypothetical protein VF152_11300 [Acidimicrobiia bacterium]
MGLLDKLKGVKKPDEGTPAVPRDELDRRLLALNGEQVPFTVSASADADLVAEWRIVDASWYEVFAKAGLEKSHRILLALDEDAHEVRALEESWEVAWEAGVPRLSLSAEKFRGRTLGSKQFGKGYAFRGVNPLDFGQVYEYRFDVSEMKDPIAETVTGAGWSFVPVTSKGKLGS